MSNRELEPELMKFNLRGNYGESMVCPVCGFDYNHILKVSVNPAGKFPEQSVDIDNEGVHMRKTTVDGRGVAVMITFGCEQGHHYTYKFHFHKGFTTLNLEVHEDFERWTDAYTDIWRD